MFGRAGTAQIVELTPDLQTAAAATMAMEHAGVGDAAATDFGDPDVCRRSLAELRADGFVGYAALEGDEVVGVMCVGTFPPVGFVPAGGFAIQARQGDPTSIVVALLAAVTPTLLDRGVVRITLDHVADERVRRAVHDAGFGVGSVFAVRSTSRLPISDVPVGVRRATIEDLDSIVELSQIELLHRYQPPIHALEPERPVDRTRALHAALFGDGGVHLLASLDGRDVGLLTIEPRSPTPRLCPDGAHIGPTATRPDGRGLGVGTALVAAALDEARERGRRHLSVDFESANPLSRPFWLGLGFAPTGYRQRRVIRLA